MGAVAPSGSIGNALHVLGEFFVPRWGRGTVVGLGSVFLAGRLLEGRSYVADLVENSRDVFDFVDAFELGSE